MTYEWLNSNFDVRACWDFRTGSAYELKNGIAPTVVGSPRMVPGDGLVYPSTGTTNVHYGDILPLNTSQPFTWIWKVSTFNNWNNSPWSSILNKNGSTNNFYLVQITSTGITIQLKNATDRLGISSFPSKRNSNICIIFAYNGGLKASGCSMFVDGSSMAFSVDNDSLTPAILGSTANFNLGYTGGNLSKSTCFKHFSWLNQAVTPAQAAAIYEQLSSEQPVTHRPTRAYSIPSPSMTPAEYAAKGIIYDTDMQVVNGKVRDLTGGGRDGTPTKTIDKSKNGPFDGGMEFYGGTISLPAFDSTIFRSNDWSVSAWVKQRSTPSGTKKIFMSHSAHYIGHTVLGRWLVGTQNAATTDREAITPNNTIVSGRWDHIIGQRRLVGSDLVVSFYVNGILVKSNTFVGEGVSIPAANQPTINGNADSLVSVSSLRYYNRAITADEARAEYLAGNKILFDGRLPKDGSCPVTPTAITGANARIPGTPWSVSAGGVKITEDAPTSDSLGKRKITSTAVSTQLSALDNSSPYGSWLIEFNHASSNGTYITFIADRIGGINGANGYDVAISATGMVLLRRTISGGAAVNLLTTSNGYVSNGVTYQLWITRGYDSKFTLWINGGAYTSWTLVPGMAVPIDSTYTTSKYINVYTVNSGDEIGDVIHYSC